MTRLPTDPLDIGEGPDAVLLLHGFTGSPYELHPLAEHLAASGYRAVAPLLPGHGHDASHLGASTLDDWLAGCREALEGLVAKQRKVFLAGFSLGGCLSILLAAERRREIAALALLAPALDFHGASRLYRDAFRLPYVPRLLPVVRKGSPDVRDPMMRLLAPVFPEVPTKAARQLHEASARALAALPQVVSPCLVLWGVHDAVVPRRAAELAAARVGSGPARLAVFGASAHQLALDAERVAVAQEIERFFGHFKTEQ